MLGGNNKNGIFFVPGEASGRRIFHCIAGATDAARDKPARDPADLALAGSDHEPGDTVWFVGDSLVDLQCGSQRMYPCSFGK